MKFHLAHIVPGKTAHGLHGYKEVIESVQWGLEQLGHSVTYGLNALSDESTNIVFGFQLFLPDVLEKLRDDTIVYHLEQLRGLALAQVKVQVSIAARRFRVWEYSNANLGVWQALGAKDVTVVPIGFSPNLVRIPKAAVQDIDVLIYGSPGNDRMSAFHHLAVSGLTVLFVSGLYGRARDDLISRAKIVLNINKLPTSKIFEVVRVSYLLANRKLVVADIEPDNFIEPDIRAAVVATSAPQLVHECNRLCADDAARGEWEETGFEAIRRRDVRQYLADAL